MRTSSLLHVCTAYTYRFIEYSNSLVGGAEFDTNQSKKKKGKIPIQTEFFSGCPVCSPTLNFYQTGLNKTSEWIGGVILVYF